MTVKNCFRFLTTFRNDMVENRNDMAGSQARRLSVGLVLDAIALGSHIRGGTYGERLQ
jgi:hypothetical protein